MKLNTEGIMGRKKRSKSVTYPSLRKSYCTTLFKFYAVILHARQLMITVIFIIFFWVGGGGGGGGVFGTDKNSFNIS